MTRTTEELLTDIIPMKIIPLDIMKAGKLVGDWMDEHRVSLYYKLASRSEYEAKDALIAELSAKLRECERLVQDTRSYLQDALVSI